MKRTSILVVVLLFISTLAHADIAPDPESASKYFTLKKEKVSISIGKEGVNVVADFTVSGGAGGEKIPVLQYCRPLPEGGTECGQPYYKFYFVYPLLAGQDFESFNVFVNGEDMSSYARKEDSVSGINLDGVQGWLKWASPNLEKKDVKFPIEMNLKVIYIEPIKLKDNKTTVVYVLRSGALWKGTIGLADIEVNSFYKDIKFSIPPTKEDGGKYYWSFTKLKPTEDLVMEIKK